MPNVYFAILCKFCGSNTIALDDGPESDEIKIAGMYCPKCDSRNTEVQAMDDAYYSKHPDAPRLTSDTPLYPYEPPKGLLN